MNVRQSVLNIAPYHPGKKITGAVKLSSNENPLGPSPMAIESISNHMQSLHTYPDGAGTVLIHQLAKNYNLKPEQFVLGNGSDEVFLMAAGMLIEPGDKAITARETFSQYKFAVQVFGGTMIEVPLNIRGEYDLETILKEAHDPKTKIVFLCNPNNPTGTWFNHSDIRNFLLKIPSKILVVLDEAYGEYADDPEYPDSFLLLQEFPNLLVTRTFSKIYGIAGLRVGYGMGEPRLIENLKRLKSPFNINNLALEGARAALLDKNFVKKSIETNKSGKILLSNLCKELGFPFFPSQGNFLCIDVRSISTADVGYTSISNGGVTIRSLTSFGLPNFIRITIGTTEQLEILKNAMGNYVSGLRK